MLCEVGSDAIQCSPTIGPLEFMHSSAGHSLSPHNVNARLQFTGQNWEYIRSHCTGSHTTTNKIVERIHAFVTHLDFGLVLPQKIAVCSPALLLACMHLCFRYIRIYPFFFFFGSYFIIIIRMECSKTEHWNMMNNVCFYYNAVALSISCVSFVVSLKPELRWIFIYICMHLFVWIELGSASVPSTNMIWMSFSYFVSLYLIFFLLGLCVYFPMILSYWKRENFVLTHTHTHRI